MTSSSGFVVGFFWDKTEVLWKFTNGLSFFLNESSSMDVKSPHFPSLGGYGDDVFFRERNSWSCFVGQSVAKFSLRF